MRERLRPHRRTRGLRSMDAPAIAAPGARTTSLALPRRRFCGYARHLPFDGLGTSGFSARRFDAGRRAGLSDLLSSIPECDGCGFSASSRRPDGVSAGPARRESARRRAHATSVPSRAPDLRGGGRARRVWRPKGNNRAATVVA